MVRAKLTWVIRIISAIALTGILLLAADLLTSPAQAEPVYKFAISTALDSDIMTASPEAGWFGFVRSAQADTIKPPVIPRPNSLIGPNPEQNPVDYFKSFLGALVMSIIGILGFLAVFFLVYGGFLYVTSGGDPAKAEKGKSIVMYAVIGLLLASFSYAIVSTLVNAPKVIEQQLEQDLTAPEPSNAAPTGGDKQDKTD